MFLNGYSLIGGIISITASIILYISCKSIRIGRILLIASGYLLFNLVFTLFSTVDSFNNFPFFCSVISINIALFNERLYKERTTKLGKLSIIMLLCFIIFMFITLILPNNIVFEVARINMFYLIMLIFIPYTSEVLIAYINKENKSKYKVVKTIKESNV